MVREIVEAAYGLIFSCDEKTHEIIRIYHLASVTPPKIVNQSGTALIPTSIMSEARLKSFQNTTTTRGFTVDEDGNKERVVFSPPVDNNGQPKNWFQKIDDKYLNDETLDAIEAYNKFVGMISGLVFASDPDPVTKGIAGAISVGSKAFDFFYSAKKSLNALKRKNNVNNLDVVKEIDKNLRLYNKLTKDVKKIGDTPLDKPVEKFTQKDDVNVKAEDQKTISKGFNGPPGFDNDDSLGGPMVSNYYD
jgi:hypothetical protein